MTKVLFERTAKQMPHATGIIYVKDEKEVKVHASKEVILSGGVFGSPQVLLHSGIGPKQHLKEIGVGLKCC